MRWARPGFFWRLLVASNSNLLRGYLRYTDAQNEVPFVNPKEIANLSIRIASMPGSTTYSYC